MSALPGDAPKDRDGILADAVVRLRAYPYDEQAWGVVYHAFWPYVVFVVGLVLAPDDDEVPDVAQDVFLRLLRAGPLAEFHSVAALRAYVRLVALNVARNRLRARRAEVSVLSDSVEAVAERRGTDEPAGERVAIRDLVRVLARELSETDRRLVTFLLEGYGLGEIAERLGISPNSMRVRAFRLRQRVRRLEEESARGSRAARREDREGEDTSAAPAPKERRPG